MVEVKKIDPIAFEPLIIYKCLLDSTYLGTVINFLKPEYFNNQDIKNIIGIITNFYEKNNTAPTTTEIKTYLINDSLKQSFKNVINSFETIDKNLNTQELYENTEVFLKQKSIEKTLLTIFEKMENGGIEAGEAMELWEKASSVTLATDLGLNYLNDIERFSKEITKVENYISSGYKWLDEKLGGGFLQEGKALYVFSGQTNVGKSIVLGNLASNICDQGKTVLLVTLEMSELVYAKRLCGCFSGISMNAVKHKLDEFKDNIEQYKRENPKSCLIIKEFPTGSITVGNLSAYIKKLVQTGIKPDVIVVDYINLLTTSFGNNSYEKIKHITETLRGLSYTFGVPIITATQLNRSAYNQTNPGLETVSESIGLAMTADCVIGLWRDPEDEELGRIRMNIQKNRQGNNFGKAVFTIDFSTMKIREETQADAQNAVSETEATLNTIQNRDSLD